MEAIIKRHEARKAETQKSGKKPRNQ